MKHSMKLFFGSVLVFGIGTAGCSGLLSSRIGLKDLPQTHYEVTRYTSGTKGLAIIFDDPNDNVRLTVSQDKFRAKREGSGTPQTYLKDFIWTPKAYEVQDKETGAVLGYLLISPELEWLVHYNKAKGKVSIWINDPHDSGANGGC